VLAWTPQARLPVAPTPPSPGPTAPRRRRDPQVDESISEQPKLFCLEVKHPDFVGGIIMLGCHSEEERRAWTDAILECRHVTWNTAIYGAQLIEEFHGTPRSPWLGSLLGVRLRSSPHPVLRVLGRRDRGAQIAEERIGRIDRGSAEDRR